MQTGSAVGILGSFGLAVYAFATPHGPNRAAIASIAVAGLIVGCVARILPSERIIRSRWREAFLVLWSSISIFVVAVIAQLDGGVDSPATILFVLPVLFAALTSPLRVTIVVGAIDIAAFLLARRGLGRRSRLQLLHRVRAALRRPRSAASRPETRPAAATSWPGPPRRCEPAKR